MAKEPKRYRLTKTKSGYSGTRTYLMEGTLEELLQACSYTLECGKSYEHERGRAKINRTPKTMKSLCLNLEKAADNAARNGYSGCSYSFEELPA